MSGHCPKGLSIRAYAAHRRQAGLSGGSRRAVEVALSSGRITRNGHGKIDPAKADAEWRANTRVAYLPPRPALDGAAIERAAAALERIAAALEAGRAGAAAALGPHFGNSAHQVGLR